MRTGTHVDNGSALFGVPVKARYTVKSLLAPDVQLSAEFFNMTPYTRLKGLDVLCAIDIGYAFTLH
jgi:hypothetical protein